MRNIVTRSFLEKTQDYNIGVSEKLKKAENEAN